MSIVIILRLALFRGLVHDLSSILICLEMGFFPGDGRRGDGRRGAGISRAGGQ